MERTEILSSDLGTATITSTGVTFISTPGTFFYKILNYCISKYSSGDSENDNIIKDTVAYIMWNFFKFYADCDCHYMYDKSQITDNMIDSDIFDIMTTVTNYMEKNKIGPFYTMKSYNPDDVSSRNIQRTDKGMGEISPINADIDTLLNPSNKTRSESGVEENYTNTSVWNKMQILRNLVGDYSVKYIVEKRLAKYIYELNKIY